MWEFNAAVTVGTALWGGQSSAILPVDDVGDNSWVDTLIRRFRVDALVAIGQSEQISEVVARHEYLPWPHPFMGDNPLVAEAPFGMRWSPLDVEAPLDDLWRRELRYQERTVAVLPTWEEDDELAGTWGALFGRYPSANDPWPSLRAAFLRAARPAQVDLGDQAPRPEWLSLLTPLTATQIGLRHQETVGGEFPGIVIGDASDPVHLARFWNLRSAGTDVLFVPESSIDTFLDLIQAHIKNISVRSPRVSSGERLMHVWNCADPISDGAERGAWEVPERMNALLPDGASFLVSHLNESELSSPIFSNMPPAMESRRILASVEERLGAPYVVADLGKQPFSEGRTHQHEWQLWTWSIDLHTSSRLPGDFTLRLPLRADLNEWYGRRVYSPSPTALRVQPRGLDIIAYVYDSTLRIGTIEVGELVARLLETAGYSAERSTPGDVTQHILDKNGGLAGMFLFRVRGVRRLLAAPKARTGIKFSHAAELIRDVDRTSGKESFGRFSGFWRHEVTPAEIFRELLHRETFRPGLALSCPNCRLRRFLDADRIGSSVTCPICGHAFPLAPYLTGDDWVFRLSGIFEREGSPAGAIPTILAMQELARIALPGANEMFVRPSHLLRSGAFTCEVDIVAVELDRDGVPSVCIGECKGQDSFTDQDAANLKTVRAAIREADIDCYLLFAVLRDEFTAEELAILRGLREEFDQEWAVWVGPYQSAPADPPILFTNRELEAEPGPLRPGDTLPHAHPFSLRQLADNSAAKYLS